MVCAALVELNAMRKLSVFILSCLSLLFSTQMMAVAKNQASHKIDSGLVFSTHVIKNLNTVMHDLEQKSTMTVVFPKRVPAEKHKTFYASGMSFADQPNYNQFWQISVSSSAKCQTKGCVIGSLSATLNQTIETTYIQAPFSDENKPIAKEKVELSSNQIAYFTPGHAEADWHPPMVEWEKNHVLYQLSWDMKGDAKAALVTMAKSAIK